MSDAAHGGAYAVVLGDAALDTVVRPAAPAEPGGDVPAAIRRTVGGAGANTAAWLAELGARVALLGRVGDDPAGRQVVGELTARGVRCALAVDAQAPTCSVVALVDSGGQRTMFSDRGAAARLHPADLDTVLIRGARHLHVSGYLLLDESSRSAAMAALRVAAEAAVPTSVDPQTSVALGAAMLELVRGVDLLLPNTFELAALTGSAAPESAVTLLDRVGAVVVTAGADGAALVDRDGIRAVPAEQVECVDSTGAGDAFAAGLIASLIAGAEPLDALRSAVRAGTAAVQVIGASPR